MKKIVTAALVLAGVALAAPAHADDDANLSDPFGSAGVVCTLETAVVPVLTEATGHVGDQHDNCSHGNVLDTP
ncbi:hypothetical protein ACF059_25365 [Streptomyces sp. NPDC016562]|uniref:hypothetical protein n=1 Tax=Streptomyces sp. NPDC016562 TaxID=3364966 RepID=UPI0036F5CA20